ncbi:hypothetical protein B484DRAFT_431258 [Ochromonadaceae sp. CCMP2298]|nr:hypothetical protein B484DRAFT_431258 [Ochromonadaceae sp. CCMP2298]
MKGAPKKTSAQGKQGGGVAPKKSSSLSLDTGEGVTTTKKAPGPSLMGKQTRTDKGTGAPSMRSPLNEAPVYAKKARNVLTPCSLPSSSSSSALNQNHEELQEERPGGGELGWCSFSDASEESGRSREFEERHSSSDEEAGAANDKGSVDDDAADGGWKGREEGEEGVEGEDGEDGEQCEQWGEGGQCERI